MQRLQRLQRQQSVEAAGRCEDDRAVAKDDVFVAIILPDR